MPHFLIIDDQPEIRNVWKDWLESQNHTYEEVGSYMTAVTLIKENYRKYQNNEAEPFDLILLDHDLGGGKYGLNVLEKVDRDYVEHRVIVITASLEPQLGAEYAKWGSIGHLIKPTSEPQFWVTIASALQRQQIYLDSKLDWEEAYELLKNEGLIESIENFSQIEQQYQVLQATHQQLLEDLKNAGEKEQNIGEAYRRASEALNNSTGSIESILPFLEPFQYTKPLWEDIEDSFATNRLYFFILQSYLRRIADNTLGTFSKHLAPRARNHHEYRVGRCYRLYYRREGTTIILERFGHKNVQEEIIKYLSDRNDPVYQY